MAEDVYMQFLNGVITESAASTLTELEIYTGATIGGMVQGNAIALEIREVLLVGSQPADNPAAVAKEEMKFAFSVQPGLAAMPTLDDVHVIYYHERALRAGVATYLPLVYSYEGYPQAYQYISPLLVPYSKIYAYLISTNASAAAIVRFRVGFTYVELAGQQIVEALEVWRAPVV